LLADIEFEDRELLDCDRAADASAAQAQG
jgi:hypothetical protein